MTRDTDDPSVRAHLGDFDDPGLIHGSCSDCGKVLYSTTTAAPCHRAGDWMREPNPHYVPSYLRHD